jgi:hypothetical protein
MKSTLTSKRIAALLFAASAMTATSWAHGPAGHDHAKDHQPAHGGIVVEQHHFDWELVAKPERIVLHARELGKPFGTAGASGKLTLLSGKDKTEAPLKPAGDNRLEAVGPFKLGPGTKVVATVTLAGRPPANVRFTLR